MENFTFCAVILVLVVMISFSFHILSKRFYLKREGLPDGRVASITKKEYGFTVHFNISISDEWLN